MKYIFEILAFPIQLDRKCSCLTESICPSAFPRWPANERIALKGRCFNWAVRNKDHLSSVLLFLSQSLCFVVCGCDGLLCVWIQEWSVSLSVWRCGVRDSGGWALDLMSSSGVRTEMIKCCSSLQSDNRCSVFNDGWAQQSCSNSLDTFTSAPIIAKNQY